MASWKYKEITIPDDIESRRPNGTVLEHRYIAEQKLGRKLTAFEVVHHIDENRENNDPENLLVFRTQSDHARFHKGGQLLKHDDGTYSSPKKTIKCLVCESYFEVRHKTQTLCSDNCRAFSRRKVARPSKVELESLVASKSFTSIAKMYGVSDNAVRKWCRNYSISI